MQQVPLTFEAAQMRGEQGMARVQASAEAAHPAWMQRALAKLLAHVQTIPHGQPFIAEDIRLAIEASLPAPPDNRVWGPLTKTATAKRYIVRTGNFAPAKSSNASPKALYIRGGAV